ncbi:MAG: shikimate dehydrogenase [Candidatus Nanohaloarchaea archaeon]|jgi:shikimate dehydrogenase
MVSTIPKLCGSVAGEASGLGVKMHNAGYEEKGLDYTYIAIGAEDIEETLETVQNMGFNGLSVSMPFKQSIIPLLDHNNDDVETIGACNTVVIEKGETTGYNTDWRGAINALKETAELDVEKAEIIGAGGVARAIAYGLKQQDIEVHISARNEEQRKELVQDLNLAGETNLEVQGEAGAELIVNATPVAEQPDSPVKLEKHESGEWLLDVVFTDIQTDIIRDAEEKGWKTTKGWRMLLHQALKQFELYTGEEAPEEEMGEVLKEGLTS